MSKYRFDGLVDYLRERHGDDLRWVANYNSDNYGYTFHHIRGNLKAELKGIELDYVIHRSLAVYNKRHAEEVYFHLGDANYLLVDYDRGTAFHVFLDDDRGVTVMLEPDVPVELPTFVEDCRERIVER